MSSGVAQPTRRLFLQHTAKLAAAGIALPAAAHAAVVPSARARSLAFDHTHTGERLELLYAAREGYIPDALSKLNRFLRDHYTGKVGRIDPKLFDVLYRIRSELGARSSFQVISGYRSPQTNGRLAARSGGVAKRSLHMDGKAIDIRLPGVPLAEVRDAARSLRAGGVGYYPRDQFVHIDTGRVRSW